MDQRKMNRGLRATVAVVLGPCIYIAIWFGLILALDLAGRPVGPGKRHAFGVLVIPIFLLALGWLQRWRIFLFNVVAVLILWGLAWRFSSTYIPENYVGSFVKQSAISSFLNGTIAVLICGIVAGVRAAVQIVRHGEFRVSIPFKGKVRIFSDGSW